MKTITIGEHEFVFSRHGPTVKVTILARQDGVAAGAVTLQMTKGQASTLGDVFKALAR